MTEAHLKEEFLTVRECARLLNVSVPTAYRMIRAKTLPHTKVGEGRGLILVARPEVTHYIESLKIAARRNLTSNAS